jgi:hypothetical protein
MNGGSPICIRSMVGGAGMEDCPDMLKAAIMLMAISERRIHSFLLFINSKDLPR